MDADDGTTQDRASDLATQTGLPRSPLKGLSPASRAKLVRLNRERYNTAQAEGRSEAEQLEYRRENDDGPMLLAACTRPVVQLTQRVREVDEWAMRRRMATVADHRRAPNAMRREAGHERREGDNARHRGSRRTTGSGSTSSGEDEPPSSERACANCSGPLPPDSAPQRRFCEDEDCKRDRDRQRKAEQRRRRKLLPRENLWDPVAQRWLPAVHKRVTGETDEAGKPEQRWERIQLRRDTIVATVELAEKAACNACAELYLEYGRGERCFGCITRDAPAKALADHEDALDSERMEWRMRAWRRWMHREIAELERRLAQRGITEDLEVAA